jgi:hypothetical protein
MTKLLVQIGSDILYSSPLLNSIAAVTLSSLAALPLSQIFPAFSLLNLMEKTVIVDKVEDRSTLDVTVWDELGAYHWSKGQPVTIIDSDDNALMFSGYVDSSTETMLEGGGGAMYHKVACVDNHYKADKRAIIKGWINTEVSEMVSYVFTNILMAEGISLGAIIVTSPAVMITQAFTCMVNSFLDQCATYAGYTWFISADKKFYFIPRTTYPAPFDIEKVGDNYPYVKNNSLTVVSGNPEFRDYQYMKGGKNTTDAQTECAAGDGNTTTFPVGYPIAEAPLVYVSLNGGAYVAKTVGIKSVDTSKDWYWSEGDNTISQDYSGTKLLPTSTGYVGDIIKMVYKGNYDIMAVSLDFDAILARQAIEGGGTGYVENIQEETALKTSDSLILQANKLLAQYAVVGDKITYTTSEPGLAAGQLQYVTSPEHDLVHVGCLVTQIKTRDEKGYTWFDVTLASGPVEDYWVKVFLSLSQSQAPAASTASSTVIIIPVPLSKNWLVGDSPNIFSGVTMLGLTTTPSTSGWPCFASGDEIKYLEVNISGGFRRYRTSQTILSNKITTICIIPSGSANGSWTTVKMYGGSAATDVIGSGILLDTFSYSHTKNALEIIQFIVTDNKWA